MPEFNGMSIFTSLFHFNEKTPVAAGVSEKQRTNEVNDMRVQQPRQATKTQAQAIPAVVDGGKTPFKKQLQWWIASQNPVAMYMEIRPDMAEEMLRFNSNGSPNRPCTLSTCKKYGDLIARGYWGHNGEGTSEPIIFSNKGRLLSGQHRLTGVVIADKAQRFLIVFGEPDENFAYIDQGRRRTGGDIFSIYKVPNYSLSAAATSWVWKYETQRYTNTPPSAQELYEFYLMHEGMQGSMRVGRMFSNSGLAVPAVMVAFHYLCGRKNRSQANEFFEQVAEGVGITSKKSPAYNLRKRLLANQASASAKLSNILVAAFTVKSWNALRDGRPLGVLKWRTEQSPNEPFPRIK